MLCTPRLRLEPAGNGDVERLCALLWCADVRRYLCDDSLVPRDVVEAWIAESLDPAAGTSFWRIVTEDGRFAGLVGTRPPPAAAASLRSIGWRSLELVIALDPHHWRRGLAAEAVAGVIDDARRDGVTFALLACVDEPNVRSHRLMQRCGFVELGRILGPAHQLIVYELPL